jgi:hypothetical protein
LLRSCVFIISIATIEAQKNGFQVSACWFRVSRAAFFSFNFLAKSARSFSFLYNFWRTPPTGSTLQYSQLHHNFPSDVKCKSGLLPVLGCYAFALTSSESATRPKRTLNLLKRVLHWDRRGAIIFSADASAFSLPEMRRNREKNVALLGNLNQTRRSELHWNRSSRVHPTSFDFNVSFAFEQKPVADNINCSASARNYHRLPPLHRVSLVFDFCSFKP